MLKCFNSCVESIIFELLIETKVLQNDTPNISSNSQTALNLVILHLENQIEDLKQKIKTLNSNLSKTRKRIKKINNKKKSFAKENTDLVRKFTEFFDFQKNRNMLYSF